MRSALKISVQLSDRVVAAIKEDLADSLKIAMRSQDDTIVAVVKAEIRRFNRRLRKAGRKVDSVEMAKEVHRAQPDAEPR